MDTDRRTEGAVVLTVDGLDRLIHLLAERGHRVVGPVLRDGAIVPGPVSGVADLPRGVGDEQDAGRYRTRTRADDALFGWAATGVAWKSVLFPARELLRSGSDDGSDDGTDDRADDDRPLAVVGVRPCDVHAIAVHDRVLAGRDAVDPRYLRRRRDAVLVAVECTAPSGTCFCASMGTGPGLDGAADGLVDVTLTELLDPPAFLARPGTSRGADLLAALPSRPAGEADLAGARAAVTAAASRMGRHLDADGLREDLYAAAADPRWEQVAQRCLACANCTLACPTCFCTGVEEVSALSAAPQRWRVWASCFTSDFSYLHGGSVRASTASRYRQWATHKLASWHDQFGTSGCVGCGRCITWCPAGIDLVAEVTAVRPPGPAVRPSRQEA